MKLSLGARYNLDALRPPDPGTGLPAPDAAAAKALHALRCWCLTGSGPGNTPWWRPLALPAVQTRLALTHLDAARANGFSPPQSLAAQLMLDLDGSLLLLACRTPTGRWALRLKTKAQDMMWWRPRQPADAWDCGCVRDTAAGLLALARFVPRRATLLVVDGLTDATVATVATLWLALQARQHGFAHPVRVLVLGPTPSRTPGPQPLSQ